eukprot:1148744-Pelagomonas_calceolata.AAC.1
MASQGQGAMGSPGPEARSVFAGGGPRIQPPVRCERFSRGSMSLGPVLGPKRQWMSWLGTCLLELLCSPCMCGCLFRPVPV